jgi:hypothetical protein
MGRSSPSVPTASRRGGRFSPRRSPDDRDADRERPRERDSHATRSPPGLDALLLYHEAFALRPALPSTMAPGAPARRSPETWFEAARMRPRRPPSFESFGPPLPDLVATGAPAALSIEVVLRSASRVGRRGCLQNSEPRSLKRGVPRASELGPPPRASGVSSHPRVPSTRGGLRHRRGGQSPAPRPFAGSAKGPPLWFGVAGSVVIDPRLLVEAGREHGPKMSSPFARDPS